MSTIKSLNIYNVADIGQYVERVISDVREAHIRTWFRTTYLRWFRHESDNVRIMVPGVFRNLHEPFGLRSTKTDVLATSLKHDVFHFVDDYPTEQWAIDAMLHGKLLWWVEPRRRATDILRHWIDFMRTLPADKPIRQSVDAMIEAVRKYDEMLERQKLIDNLNDGVLKVHEDPQRGFQIVRLDTREAVRAEGAYMKHCIWTSRYDLRLHTRLFSIRSIETGLPLASIEVRAASIRLPADKVKTFCGLSVFKREFMDFDGYVLVQVSGPRNREVADEVLASVNEWFVDSCDHRVNLVSPPPEGNPTYVFEVSGKSEYGDDDDDGENDAHFDDGEADGEDDDDDAEDEAEPENDDDKDKAEDEDFDDEAIEEISAALDYVDD